jgi:phage-related protein
LVKGIIGSLPTLIALMPQIVMSMINGLVKGVPQMVNVGKNLIKGLWEGIKSSGSWLINKFSGWADNMLSKVKKIFKIGSPSKLWRDEVGVYLAQGVGVGFDEELSSVYDDMQRAINLEQAKLQANVETGKVFNSLANSTPIAISLDASVEMDSQKVGRLVTPAVSETLKTGGLR